MKQVLLILTMFLTTSIANAQWEAPYFPTGMTWEERILDFDTGEPEWGDVDTFEIGNDTIINKRTYKKVMCNGKQEPVWVREQDNIVWLLTDVSPQELKLYDFNWDEQQEITTEYFRECEDGYQLLTETFPAKDVTTTSLHGTEVQYYRQSFTRTTIRGIGNVIELNRDGSHDNHFTCLLGYCMPQYVLPGLIYKKVISVQRNGVEIYRSENFDDWIDTIPNGFHPLQDIPKSFNTLFDLQGRPLSTPPSQGMYIRDGKKVWVK